MPLKYLESTLLDELKIVLAKGINLSKVDIKEGVVLIPYVRSNKRYIIQIALKDTPQAQTLKGLDWPALNRDSDIYVIKVLPADPKDGEKKYPAAEDKAEGLLFLPKHDFKHGEPLDISLIKTKRASEEARKLLFMARDRKIELSISGHLRGVDGAGSSLDLPEFQKKLTEAGVTDPQILPSTPTIASAFSVKIRFEAAADPDVIEYIAPDYDITAQDPYKVYGPIVLNKDGKTPKGQKDAPAFIFRNIFGLRGVRIICEEVPPMALAGGMESSNMFNVALISAASMLSGADLSLADIFSLAVKLENDEFNGLTGGQGHLSSMLGGAYRNVWLSGVKDAAGKLTYPYAAFSTPLLEKSDLTAIEEHMALVQAGKEYKDGKALVGRTATLINWMWTDLLRDNDAIGAPLHRSKLALAARYTQALRDKDFKTAVEVINKYVDTRDKLCLRWMNLMLDARAKINVPEYAKRYADDVFNSTNPRYNDYETIRETLKKKGENFLRTTSLYTLEPIAGLVKKARTQGIAIMPLGAGGPGANLIAISSVGLKHLKDFLESEGVTELNDAAARAVIHGDGLLKGYIPFKVGKEPVEFSGFADIGLSKPEKPAASGYDQASGKIKPASGLSTGSGPVLSSSNPSTKAQGSILSNVEGSKDGEKKYPAGKKKKESAPAAKSSPEAKAEAAANTQEEVPDNLAASPITKAVSKKGRIVEKAHFIYTIDKSVNLPPLGAFRISSKVTEAQLTEWNWQIDACLNQICAGIAFPSHSVFPNMIDIKVVSGLSTLSEVILGKEPKDFTILLDEELLKSLDAKWLLYMELENKLLRMCIGSLKNRLPPAAEDIALTLVYLARFNSFEERKRHQTIAFLNDRPGMDIRKFRDVLVDSQGSSPEEMAGKIAAYHIRKGTSCDKKWLNQSIPIWRNAMSLFAYSNILANLLKQDVFIAPQLKIGPPQPSKAFWSATEWTRVFGSMSARLAGRKGEKEKKVQTVDIEFKHVVRGRKNMSLNIPARLTGREYLIIARVILMYINDHVVNEGSFGVEITISDRKLEAAIQKMLRSDYQKAFDYVRQYYQIAPGADIISFVHRPDNDVRPYKKNIVIGLDLGGSSKVKAAVIENGQIVYHDVFLLPGKKEAEDLANTDEYVNVFAGIIREVIAKSKIMEGRQCKKENEVIYAIGISWAGAVNDKGEIVATSKIIKKLADNPEEQPYLKKIRHLGELLSKRTGFYVRMVNDGDALAFGLATYAERKDTLCLGFGTGLAVGYVNEHGMLESELGEGSKTITDMADDSAAHTGTGVSGVAQQYASQSGVIRVAEGYREFQELLKNVEVKHKASRVGKLVELYNTNGEAVMDKVADYIAVTIAKLHPHYRMDHVILSGGVMNSESGAVILAKVREKIRANFPVVDPANIETSGTIEKMVEGMQEKVEIKVPKDKKKVNYSDYANAIGAAQNANLKRQGAPAKAANTASAMKDGEKKYPAGDANTPETEQEPAALFGLLESQVNNERTKIVDKVNGVIAAMFHNEVFRANVGAVELEKKQATAALKDRIGRVISTVESLGRDDVSADVRQTVDHLKKRIDQLEADGIVASVINLARKAKYENQKLIIGLETDWIPGYNETG
ncbi:MAG: ROK family protein, partial [Candidatus Omnitrophica bacterium]|nr:ROK family protein [Candidatus Omnitrophota bacterium]